ncbi:MAG: hypothetical protein J5780_06990 [Treponema sp.]|nr:hypothetical protein [Treponema sp.]
MYGVKLYAVPENLDATIELWHRLKFDTLFIGQGCKNDSAFLERLQHEGFFVNLVEPVFLPGDDVQVSDSLLSVTKDGLPARDTWVRFICPSNEEWLSSFYSRLESDAKLNISSLSLDFIRFFQFWEVINPEDNSVKLTETCFCPKCTEQRKKFSSDEEWRVSVINSVAEKSREIIRKTDAGKKMGLHTVPWKKSTFDGAARRVLGQDLEALSKYVDFFTPMTYHHMMGTKVSYIGELLEDFYSRTDSKIPIIPSVQLKKYYREEDISIQENLETIKTGLQYGKNNLVFFQWKDIEQNKEITALLESFAETIDK